MFGASWIGTIENELKVTEIITKWKATLAAPYLDFFEGKELKGSIPPICYSVSPKVDLEKVQEFDLMGSRLLCERGPDVKQITYSPIDTVGQVQAKLGLIIGSDALDIRLLRGSTILPSDLVFSSLELTHVRYQLRFGGQWEVLSHPAMMQRKLERIQNLVSLSVPILQDSYSQEITEKILAALTSEFQHHHVIKARVNCSKYDFNRLMQVLVVRGMVCRQDNDKMPHFRLANFQEVVWGSIFSVAGKIQRYLGKYEEGVTTLNSKILGIGLFEIISSVGKYSVRVLSPPSQLLKDCNYTVQKMNYKLVYQDMPQVEKKFVVRCWISDFGEDLYGEGVGDDKVAARCAARLLLKEEVGV